MSDDVAEVNDVLINGPLRVRLAEWLTWQEASYHLGILCGLYPVGVSYDDHCREYGSWWYKNDIAFSMLSDCLDKLVLGEVLERQIFGEDYKYRWK